MKLYGGNTSVISFSEIPVQHMIKLITG